MILSKKKQKEPLYKDFFNVTEIRDNAVFLEDGSFHAVLEVTPVHIRRLYNNKHKELMKKFNEFLIKMHFNIEIAIRTLNDNVEKKIETFESRTRFMLKQSKDPKLLHKFEDFIKWFKPYVKNNCKVVKRHYIVVFTNGIEYKKAISVLDDRANFIIENLKKIGVPEIRRLTTNQLENLYNSYIYDTIYVKDTYFTPKEWLDLFYMKGGTHVSE